MNSLPGLINNLNQRADRLEAKLDRALDLFSRIMGNNPDEPNLRVDLDMGERLYTIDLVADIEDLNMYDSILDQLNNSGDALGYAFKKGPITKKDKDSPPAALTIVCKCYNRNPGRNLGDNGNGNMNGRANATDNTKIKDINCKVFYRFNVNPDGTVYLTPKNQAHCHPPNTGPKAELTDQMKLEISRLSKNHKVSSVRDHLETTFGLRISYSAVYNEFRRQFPRLGPLDCQYFLDFLVKNNAYCEKEINENKNLCKLLFVTAKMKSNFAKFGDIVILARCNLQYKYILNPSRHLFRSR